MILEEYIIAVSKRGCPNCRGKKWYCGGILNEDNLEEEDLEVDRRHSAIGDYPALLSGDADIALDCFDVCVKCGCVLTFGER